MPLILSTIERYKDQKIEIFVKWDKEENIVLEIKSVFIDSPVGMIPVGCLFTNIPELDVALNKIIERTDWRDIYRQFQLEMEEAA